MILALSMPPPHLFSLYVPTPPYLSLSRSVSLQTSSTKMCAYIYTHTDIRNLILEHSSLAGCFVFCWFFFLIWKINTFWTQIEQETLMLTEHKQRKKKKTFIFMRRPFLFLNFLSFKKILNIFFSATYLFIFTSVIYL